MVLQWKLAIPQLTGTKKRRAYIYLPDSYKKDPDRRYPVMYMFDGHNVFFDSHATYGKSWGMNTYMRRSKKQMIIVAVECNHEGNGRLEEYSPMSHRESSLGKIRGRGKTYMEWLVHTLKPFIDANYRTLSDRSHTLICGSSMGGLMALYAVSAYNHVFQRAACLSPSLWVSDKVMDMVKRAKIQPDTCIYMDYGSEELVNHDASYEALKSMCQLLLDKKVDLTFRIVPGGTHCEASWERQIPIFMECLNV